ncbi:hypothetical protein MWH25_02140 [Natroniella acetigena]|nr:hypothetical protein [Natroniella acetigena]
MYNLADTFWVGRLGAEYLAAISLSFLLIFLIFGWFLFPKLGIKGAAIATIFSRFIEAIIGMYLFFTGRKGLSSS